MIETFFDHILFQFQLYRAIASSKLRSIMLRVDILKIDRGSDNKRVNVECKIAISRDYAPSTKVIQTDILDGLMSSSPKLNDGDDLVYVPLTENSITILRVLGKSFSQYNQAYDWRGGRFAAMDTVCRLSAYACNCCIIDIYSFGSFLRINSVSYAIRT